MKLEKSAEWFIMGMSLKDLLGKKLTGTNQK
jgi:hypothetical protein